MIPWKNNKFLFKVRRKSGHSDYNMILIHFYFFTKSKKKPLVVWYFSNSSYYCRVIPRNSLQLTKQHVNKQSGVTLTFFFGRFTSSFIEAHLLSVLSRLKEKMETELNKQPKHDNNSRMNVPKIDFHSVLRAVWMLIWSGSSLDAQPDPLGKWTWSI